MQLAQRGQRDVWERGQAEVEHPQLDQARLLAEHDLAQRVLGDVQVRERRRKRWQRRQRVLVQVEDLQPRQRGEIRHGLQRVVTEVERAQVRQRAVEAGHGLDPELARVQPLQLDVGGLEQAPQPSYSPSSARIRRMIATEDA
jgi:hypothetical protein